MLEQNDYIILQNNILLVLTDRKFTKVHHEID